MNIFRPRLPDEPNFHEILDYIKKYGSEQVKESLEELYGEGDNDYTINQEWGKVYSQSKIIKSVDDLKEAVDFDDEKFQVLDGQHTSWGVSAKTKDGSSWIYNTNYRVYLKWKLRGLEKPDISYMKEWLQDVKQDVELPEYEYKEEKKPVVVSLGDLHIGVYFEGDGLHHDYNRDIAAKKLSRIVEMVNKMYPDRDIHYVIGGDLIESFTGKNHADMWKHIEMHGAKAAFEAFKLLKEMFMKTNNLRKVYMVGGNHDRITSDNNDDKTGQVAELLYLLFNETTNIDCEFDPHHIQTTIDGVSYIIAHGDKKFSNKKASEVIVDYGVPNIYNVIIEFHRHKFEVTEDKLKFRKVTTPSIVSSTNHGKDMGLNSPSGFIVYENVNGYTSMQIIPLHDFK